MAAPQFYEKMYQARAENKIPDKVLQNFIQLCETYSESLLSHGLNVENYHYLMEIYFERILDIIAEPYVFRHFHQKVVSPFNFYRFGIEFIRPLVDLSKSKILKKENLDKILTQIEKKENVVFFANHQTEVDPQLMSILLEEKYPKIAEEIIFVAGDRVITDPLAIPLSMGRNLLCIFSKKHIENPPEKKIEKQIHNQKTMKVMSALFKEGGKCVYVAPSGGRDRLNEQGEVEVAFFDPPSIEMFKLMANHSGTPTHFYPLTLFTFDILPPPRSVAKELGEERIAKREGARMSIGEEIDIELYSDSIKDKHQRREALAKAIWNLVKNDYQLLLVDNNV